LQQPAPAAPPQGSAQPRPPRRREAHHCLTPERQPPGLPQGLPSAWPRPQRARLACWQAPQGRPARGRRMERYMRLPLPSPPLRMWPQGAPGAHGQPASSSCRQQQDSLPPESPPFPATRSAGSAGCAAGPRALGPAAPAAACALGARRPGLCRVPAGAWSAPSCSGAGATRRATVATGACHCTCQPRGSPFRPVVVSRACVDHTVQLVCTSHITSRSTTVKSGAGLPEVVSDPLQVLCSTQRQRKSE